ncbi:Serine/threonine-protein kinase MHK [Bienertia sinuspersici]
MDRYKLLKELGDGTCGNVYKAVNKESYEIVAVKKMKRKFYFWEECVNLREVKSLRSLNHPNIIKLKEVVRENNELFFIFEYMEYNLYQLMKERQGPFSEEEIRNYLTQVLKGLAHMHSNGYFHRDLKPGMIETDQLYKICRVLGAPDWTVFPEAKNITQLINISYSEQLCSWDPLKRPTAEQALRHPFFNVASRVPRPIHDPFQNKPQYTKAKPNLELNLWDFDSKPDDCFLGLTLAVNPDVSNLELGPSVSRNTRQDIYFCSNFQDRPQQSVLWSHFSPCRNGAAPPVDPSLSLSFSSSVTHPPRAVPHSGGFGLSTLQPGILDGRLLAASSPLQPRRYL